LRQPEHFRRTSTATHARVTLAGILNIPRWLSNGKQLGQRGFFLKIVLALNALKGLHFQP